MRIFLTALLATLCCASSLFSQDITLEERAKKQCRSVHLFHEDMPLKSQAIFAEVKATKSAPGTYFCAAVFDDGYIGFQDIPGENNNVVIFSIWDSGSHGDNPNDVPEDQRTGIVKSNERAEISRFGGEGTGGKSMLRYPWKIGETMKFMVILHPVSEHLKEISGYFFNNKINDWELISRWRTTLTKNELSQATSFVEDFRRDYESIKYERAAEFGPYYILDKDGNWMLSKKVSFSADETPSKHISLKLADKKKASFTLATGGDIGQDSDVPLQGRIILSEEETSPVPTQYLNDLFRRFTEEEA